MTGRAISRRSVLRGLGAAIALPLLDAMTPAFARTPKPSPRRLLWFYIPNGVDMRHWTPAAAGPLGELPRILAPLAPLKREFSVLSNLTAHWGRPLQSGAGDHGRALGAYMCGVEVFKTAGANLRLGISADQLAARVLGPHTRLPSLELGLEEARQAGGCDSGYSCAYQFNLAWKTAHLPLPPISNPRVLFERLFGADDVEAAPARLQRMEMRRSILDQVVDSTHRLQSTLGAADRRKVDEYLSSVREVELQIEKAARDGTVLRPTMDKPFGVPAVFSDYYRMMTDMLVMALAADVTRVATMLVGREGSVRTYPEIGVEEGHHPLSHHQGNIEHLDKVRQINELHARLFAEFLAKLHATREGDGTLLDHSLIAYGSGLSDGNAHLHDQLPTLIAGRGGGAVRPGRHLVYQRETPVANLFATMLDAVGASAAPVADSTERLAL